MTVAFSSHLWHSCSCSQVPVSLASGQAETYGVTKACTRALGVKFSAIDLCLDFYWVVELADQGRLECCHRYLPATKALRDSTP